MRRGRRMGACITDAHRFLDSFRENRPTLPIAIHRHTAVIESSDYSHCSCMVYIVGLRRGRRFRVIRYGAMPATTLESVAPLGTVRSRGSVVVVAVVVVLASQIGPPHLNIYIYIYIYMF